MKISRQGFTLVEMLIVIVIIGLLATSVIPKIMNVSVKARNVARTADMRNISTALTVLLNTEGQVPNLSGAVSQLGDSLGSYIKSIPTDPNGNKLNGILGSGTTNCADYLPAGQYGYVALEGGQGFAVLSTMDDDTNVSNYNRGYSGEPLNSGSIIHGCIDDTMTRKQLREASCDITGFPGGENLFTADYDKGTGAGGFTVSSSLDFYPFAVPAPFGNMMAHRFNSQDGRAHSYVSFKRQKQLNDHTQSMFIKILDFNALYANISREYHSNGSINFKKLANGTIQTERYGFVTTKGFMSIRNLHNGWYLISVTADRPPAAVYIGRTSGISNYSNIAIRKPHLQEGMSAPCGNTVSYFDKPSGNQTNIQRRYIEISD